MKVRSNLVVTVLIICSFTVQQTVASDQKKPEFYLPRAPRLEAEEKVSEIAKVVKDSSLPLKERIQAAASAYPEAHAVRVTKEHLFKNSSEKDAPWREQQLQKALQESALLRTSLEFAGHEPEKIIREWQEQKTEKSTATLSQPLDTVTNPSPIDNTKAISETSGQTSMPSITEEKITQNNDKSEAKTLPCILL